MAYSPVFPTTYQPIGYYPQIQTSMPQTQQSNSGIIWVTGEAGAKSYMVAPNNTVQLWDSESQTIYLKSADASGMPSMRILDYTIRSNTPNSPVNTFSGGVAGIPTMDDLKALQGQIDAMQARIDILSKSSPVTKINSTDVKGE